MADFASNCSPAGKGSSQLLDVRRHSDDRGITVKQIRFITDLVDKIPWSGRIFPSQIDYADCATGAFGQDSELKIIFVFLISIRPGGRN